MILKEILAKRPNKTIYRDGDNVIKLFNSDFSKTDILNEALNQSKIENTGLNIPKIKGVTTIEDNWAIILEYIEGRTLWDLMIREQERLDEYLNQFVDLQIMVHNCEALNLNSLKHKLKKNIDKAEIDENVRYDLHTRLHGMKSRNNICHGDFNPSNIIITEEGLAYILDWAHVTYGNSLSDIAMTYMQFCLKKEDKLAKKYLDLIGQKLDIKKKSIEEWMPIVAASYSKNNTTAETRDILLSWINVMEYQ